MHEYKESSGTVRYYCIGQVCIFQYTRLVLIVVLEETIQYSTIWSWIWEL